MSPADSASLRSRVAPKAIAMAGKWSRLTQTHIPVGGLSCACNVGFGSIAVADFEQDVLDYLHARHGGVASLAPMFIQAGYVEHASGSIAALLQGIAQCRQPAPEVESLLGDLERSIGSFEEIHAGRISS